MQSTDRRGHKSIHVRSPYRMTLRDCRCRKATNHRHARSGGTRDHDPARRRLDWCWEQARYEEGAPSRSTIARKIGEYEPVHVRFVDRCGARYAKPNLTARLRRRSVHLLGLNRLQFDRKGIRGSLHHIWRQPWVARSRDLSEIIENLWCRHNRWHNLVVESIFSYSKRALHV